PIFGENSRAYVLSAIEQVDGIFIFKKQRLDREILTFKPDIYVKSGDYNIETMDSSERNALLSIGAKIHFVPFLNGFSSTSILRKITE
ncbi:MAG: hypothetical protein LBR91_00555, partial [Puniceicoccales bacterium]|nr:hypothetical protein [Puniceicoccales bacterium]